MTKQPQQLDDFFAQVERRALRMAELSTRNRDDALDIVQDAMMQLVKKYSNKSVEEWTPLFYRILNNRIMDFHRRNTTQSRWRVWLTGKDEEDLLDPLQQLPGEEMQPLEVSELNDSVEHVNVLLEQLSPRQRQAFLLRAWEGLNVAETASAMRCSVGSVKTHYSRAIHFLRQQLQDHNIT